jgi:predicted alpha/beta-fold hydrolase
VSYAPPRWLRNPHTATIYASRLAPAPPVQYRRERWDTPDGDFLDVDFVDGPKHAPRVVLLHGLEGSSASRYARALMAAVRARGWRGAVPNWRGCSGELNRKARAYHSGDSAELDFILRRLADGGPLYVAGVSLGGNVLCKWLGERGDSASSLVTAAASICAPLDLAACADALERGFARVYASWFLRTLKVSARARLRRHGPLLDGARLERARTLRDFDEVVTAPLHGFADAADYYARSSGKPFLHKVRVPLLLLNARDDPFMPGTALPSQAELSGAITAEFTAKGGHVGYVGELGDLSWLPRRLLRYFDAQPHGTPAGR